MNRPVLTIVTLVAFSGILLALGFMLSTGDEPACPPGSATQTRTPTNDHA